MKNKIVRLTIYVPSYSGNSESGKDQNDLNRVRSFVFFVLRHLICYEYGCRLVQYVVYFPEL